MAVYNKSRRWRGTSVKRKATRRRRRRRHATGVPIKVRFSRTPRGIKKRRLWIY